MSSLKSRSWPLTTQQGSPTKHGASIVGTGILRDGLINPRLNAFFLLCRLLIHLPSHGALCPRQTPQVLLRWPRLSLWCLYRFPPFLRNDRIAVSGPSRRFPAPTGERPLTCTSCVWFYVRGSGSSRHIRQASCEHVRFRCA